MTRCLGRRSDAPTDCVHTLTTAPHPSSPQVLAEELEAALEIKARELGATEALAAAAAALERRLEHPILPWQRAQYGAAGAPDAALDVDPSMLNSLLASPEISPEIDSSPKPPLPPLEGVLPPCMQTLTTAPPPTESDLPPVARAAPSVTAPHSTKLDEA